ncbi:riboflavin biosynthesis protein RibF [Candidatus Spyradosoma sp. SGI.093]|uniref:riboflavin biosynthesis protein RibF n=1 Tax=Candidatus Spyradosoma sp. SGI.093 TaxID=3420583 RepID=UPI003D05DB0E
MKIFTALSELPREFADAPAFLCVGNFDGAHRGHRALFRAAKEAAAASGGVCGALTFEPHPEIFFRGPDAVKLIYPPATKRELLARAGLDFVVSAPFTGEFAAVAAEDFAARLKRALPSLAGLFVGENFRFGARRRGDAALLRESAARVGVKAHTLAPVLFGGEKISSSRIRACLAAGETAAANAMLGEPYFAAGTVVSGNRLGRTIGFPTLNLEWRPALLPRFGVYAVRLIRARGDGASEVFRGVANYGVRPTVARDGVPAPLLETHVTDVPAGVPVPTYGDSIVVEWLDFLREERRFDSVAALREQLVRDVAAARERGTANFRE